MHGTQGGVVFRVKSELFFLPATVAQRVVPVPQIGRIPSAPPEARGMRIDLELDAPATTQDAAVAAAFLITEIVEYAMLKQKAARIEVDLRRATELNASLTVATETLVTDTGRGQFDRVVTGLARQLRSPLEEKMGRLGVNLPVFPTAE